MKLVAASIVTLLVLAGCCGKDQPNGNVVDVTIIEVQKAEGCKDGVETVMEGINNRIRYVRCGKFGNPGESFRFAF